MAKDEVIQEVIRRLRERRAQAHAVAWQEKIEGVHPKGLLTARELAETPWSGAQEDYPLTVIREEKRAE